MRRITDRMIVAYSGGKDSAVTLDLCAKNFKQVNAYYMYYLVPNLSFQKKILDWAIARYPTVQFEVLPHFDLSSFLCWGTFREPDDKVEEIEVKDIWEYARKKFNAYFIATGERRADSLWRRGAISQSSSIDFKLGKFYPCAYWNKNDVIEYVKRNHLKLSDECAYLPRGHNLGDFKGQTLIAIRDHFPEDYARIKAFYPLIEASLKQWEIKQQQKETRIGHQKRKDHHVPEVPSPGAGTLGDQGSLVQPASDFRRSGEEAQ